MPSSVESWLECAGVLLVALVLPFYLGVQHAAVPALILYCVIAGLALALAERLSFEDAWDEPASEFVADASLRSGAVLGLAAPAYVVALIAI